MSAAESPEELLSRLASERAPVPLATSFPIAVTGSRHGNPTLEELSALWRLFDQLGGTELHHGAAPGVDSAVARGAERSRPALTVVPHPANWKPGGPSGPTDYSAGPRRNADMARVCRAVIAFPGGKGTGNCIGAFRRAGRIVRFVLEEVERHRRQLERDAALSDFPYTS